VGRKSKRGNIKEVKFARYGMAQDQDLGTRRRPAISVQKKAAGDKRDFINQLLGGARHQN